jgi:adenylate cyclase
MHIHFPLAAKLSLGISALLVITFCLVTIPVFVMLRGDSAERAQENTARMNQYTYTAFQSLYTSIQADTVDFASGIDAGKTALFWRLNPHIAAIIVQYEQQPEICYMNPVSPVNYQTKSGAYSAWFSSELAALFRKSSGSAALFSTAGAFAADDLLVLRYSTRTEWGTPYMFVFFSMEHFSNVFNADVYKSALINDAGDILMQQDEQAPPHGKLFSAKTQLAGSGSTIQTGIEQAVVFESVYTTTQRTLYTMLAVWSLTMIVIWSFSNVLTRRLLALCAAAQAVENGEYHLDIHVRTRDETAVLSRAMIGLSHALGNFVCFTNRTVATLSRKNKITPGGVLKTATVFFSDIRSFTSISEKLTPEQVVEMINGYMEHMVVCVHKTGGIVDKFIGDAIMAHWGAAESAGSCEEDALAAVRCALMMRTELARFNEGRDGSSQSPLVRIGCGIATGPLVTGLIGTEERFEWTVIGETVRLSELLESTNKAHGTDVLISETTYNLIREHITAEEKPALDFNGRKEGVFAVASLSDGLTVSQRM